MMITDRDINIMRFVNQFGFSSISIIKSTFFKHINDNSGRVMTQRRLKVLKKRGFIKEIENHLTNHNIYSITESGRSVLDARGFETVKPVSQINWGEFQHDFEILKIYVRFRDLGYLKFYTERKAKEQMPFGDLVPDLIMFRNDDKALMIEIELTRKTFKRMEEKLKQYADSPYMFSLLYICGTPAIAKALNDTAEKFDELKGRFNAIALDYFCDNCSNDFIHKIMQGNLC